ncbi:hypothetical protein BKA83DRAFT_4044741, partial [Pisolithus microcarpus]
IAMCLDLSTRTIQRVLAHFWTYGTIPNPGDGTDEEMRVRKRQLRDFLLGTVQNSPDLYLDELQQMLEASCGVYVSRATVWRTLCRGGFMMKKVSSDSYVAIVTLIPS